MAASRAIRSLPQKGKVMTDAGLYFVEALANTALEHFPEVAETLHVTAHGNTIAVRFSSTGSQQLDEQLMTEIDDTIAMFGHRLIEQGLGDRPITVSVA
jgi:hypothetical protein